MPAATDQTRGVAIIIRPRFVQHPCGNVTFRARVAHPPAGCPDATHTLPFPGHFPLADQLYGLIPAAGSGARFGAAAGESPKQYHTLAGADGVERTMLAHSVRALLAEPDLAIVFVVLAPGDTVFRTLDWQWAGGRVEPLYCGGASRRDSVLNGLIAIADTVAPEDWMLVHDAARPCLDAAALGRLVGTVCADAQGPGGILAVPVADTLKRAGADGRIAATEPRAGLWQAQTPQMFRHGLLLRALMEAGDVTDEAGAVERLGLQPRLVAGSPGNLKVTLRDDLELAALVLASRAAPLGKA